ncbi:MAG: CaiB/BaiF CoA-transferase family protein [Caldilineaceae bacterium]|nr:CaiB/BaiF CoA-transferase family protein [Caldilineaceae bacterium]
MALPLSHVTVVALEQAIAAPLATRHLADLGARVIKVERPGSGDFARHYDAAARGLCSHFAWANRSKESITLDLKAAGGKEILGKLLEQADVFVQNLAPGAVERLGFDDERLRGDYPDLIVCHVSGYGADGPYRDKKAYDLLVQAETGVVAVTGSEEAAAKSGIPVADIAGGMYAYSSILAALLQRERDGGGCVLHVSLFDGLCDWMGFPAYYALGETPLPRTGASHAAIAPYGPYAAGDGRTILFSIQSQREWEQFCAVVLEKPGLASDVRFADNTRRVRNRAALQKEIESVFAGMTAKQVAERMERGQIAYAEQRELEEFWEHPQLAARGRVAEVGSPVGPLPALLPATVNGTWPPRFESIPATGEHTRALMAELGYGSEAIEGLERDGVV